jgi:hypothetical protein
VALPAVTYASVEASEIKTSLGVIKCFGIPFNELRFLALVLDVASKAKLVFVLVISLPGTDAARHLRVTTETPLVIDLTIQGMA